MSTKSQQADATTTTQRPLPAGWRWVRLGEVCKQIDYGYTATADFSVKEPRFLRITDIQNGMVCWDTVPGCMISGDQEERYRLDDGDIVFARTGATTGKSFLIHTPPRAIFASYLVRLRISRDSMSPEFIYAFFQSDDYWQQIRSKSRGAGQPNVNASLLSGVSLPLPPLSEQKRIAAILQEQMSSVERARRAAEEQLEAAQALPAAYLRQAFNSPEAQKWPRKRLGELCVLINGDAYRNTDWNTTGVPIIRIQNLNDPTKPFNYWAGKLDDRVRVKSGDVLLAWSGTPGTSFGAHLWRGPDAVLNQHIFRVDLDTAQLDSQWAVEAINEQLEIMIGKAHGGVGLRHVTKGEVERLSIAVPSISEQKRIAAMLQEQMSSVERLRRALEEQLEAIHKLPAAILRKAFNGEL